MDKILKRYFMLCGAMGFLLFFFTSCGTTDVLSCPYVIANPCVELGEIDNQQSIAGMHFSFLNESEKDIDSFTLSFMLYDSDGKNPFIGSNCIVAKCDWSVRAGAFLDFIISLDSYISVVPDEPFVVDYLYVREIRYSDGSQWRDPYGMYCVREAYE